MTRWLAVFALLAALTGCDTGKETLTVFAAASLTEPFTELGHELAGLDVTFNFGSSATLARQIERGAPADVFASASRDDMPVPRATVFARNRPAIAVPNDNPGNVRGLDDLSRVTVALCAEEVPCGRAAREALDAAGVTVRPVSLERDVKAALTKVELGEVDAALVYSSDVATSDKVTGIDFPEARAAVNEYPIAVVSDRPAARRFVDLVKSGRGREVLRRSGFEAP